MRPLPATYLLPGCAVNIRETFESCLDMFESTCLSKGPHCPFLVLFASSFYVSKRWQKSLRQKPASFSCNSCIVQKSWGFISLACVRCGCFEDLPRTTSTATQSSASSKWGTKLPSWTVASTLSQFKFGSPQWQARPLQDVPDWLMSLSCNFMMVKCWLCLNRFCRRFKA